MQKRADSIAWWPPSFTMVVLLFLTIGTGIHDPFYWLLIDENNSDKKSLVYQIFNSVTNIVHLIFDQSNISSYHHSGHSEITSDRSTSTNFSASLAWSISKIHLSTRCSYSIEHEINIRLMLLSCWIFYFIHSIHAHFYSINSLHERISQVYQSISKEDVDTYTSHFVMVGRKKKSFHL